MADNPKEYTSLEIIKLHLEKNLSLPKNKGEYELEVRFGTRNVERITKIIFDDVIKKLKSLDFTCENESGVYTLNIQNEFTDLNTGRTKISNVRSTIEGLTNIQSYCKTDSIDELLSNVPNNVSFMTKSYAKDGETTIYPVNVDDFNLRISYQNESKLTTKSSIVKSMLSNWNDTKKTFRLIHRITFTHPNYPFKVDLSIVKMGRRNKRGQMIPVYKLTDSDLFNSVERYEIELELMNGRIGQYSLYSTPEEIDKIMKKQIKIIMGGLQNTHYPVPYSERESVLNSYIKIIHGEDHKIERILPKHFCGPASFTLELKNVQPLSEELNVPNIRQKYSVTDKADGVRKLLYINDKGKVYFVTMKMSVEFTGTHTRDRKLHNTILDGEHITNDKQGRYINLFAAFDVYYMNGKSVREKEFAPSASEKTKETIYRLLLLTKITKALKLESVTKGLVTLRIEHKRFYSEGIGGTIFDGCNTILKNEEDGLFEYNTDGLIFTPMELGVGGNKKGEASKPFKLTWEHSFKWKPEKFNTIDFLISTIKDTNNQDKISNIFESGVNVKTNNLTQYKTLILRCGFDEKKHGYLNPCKDVYEDNLPSVKDKDEYNEYKPVPFYPTRPYDNDAHICNIILKTDDGGNMQMMTEDNEVFADNMIVEFRYEKSNDKYHKWVPIKVRYDKTAEFRQGIRNFGNAYHVANGNWHSIHHPVTSEMIKSGENIPTLDTDDDVYYNRLTNISHTRSLRDFHNLFVKSKLITGVSSKGDTLIDLAVGKGGDFSKWIKAKLSFVFGVDVSKDNIENRIDGACARYLTYKKQYAIMPSALFVNGNSSLNIRNTDAMFNEKSKMITQAVFGQGKKDKEILGKGVFKHYGIGSEGFSITSCQFALHYFFETTNTLQNFLRNVSECTKINGYFIGTCYNGNKIFEALKQKKQGEGIIIKNEKHKIWELRKEYDHSEFNNDETSLGYAIDIFQETINQYIREYLVNFDYLIRCMENYGFSVLDNEEAKKMGFTSGIGNFSLLHQQMEQEIEKNKQFIKNIGKANTMTLNERKISFFNNYFIFKKIRNVNAAQITLTQQPEEEPVVAQPTKEVKPKQKREKKPKLKIKTDN